MQVFVREEYIAQAPTAVALGGFDAIHIGHRTIIRRVVEEAKKKNLVSVVYLFRNCPRAVLTGEEVPMVNSFEERLEILEQMGVDRVVADWFSQEHQGISPEQFVSETLGQTLRARFVAAGFNYRFGAKGAGTIKTLRTLGANANIEVAEMECVSCMGKPVSSSRIRDLICAGEIPEANACLGREFSLSGRVEKGAQIGRTIGFPTANIPISEEVLAPRYGVYITETEVDGVRCPSMTNVGAKPTVGNTTPSVETHIPGMDKSLYDKEIKVYFHKFLREIQAFSSVEELQTQLQKDSCAVNEYFK